VSSLIAGYRIWYNNPRHSSRAVGVTWHCCVYLCICVYLCTGYIITMDKITAGQQAAIKKMSDVRLISKLANAGVAAEKSKNWIGQH